MKYLITIFKNRNDIVLIKNESESDFETPLDSFTLKSGEEKEERKGLITTLFGNWEAENMYQEEIRRKMLGIDHFELSFVEKEYILKSKKAVDKTFIENTAELEFEELDELNEDTNQCIAKTASGSRCKREKLEGSEYCALHRKKGDKV